MCKTKIKPLSYLTSMYSFFYSSFFSLLFFFSFLFLLSLDLLKMMSLTLSIRMHKDKIGGEEPMLSIRYQSYALDKWTKALKYLLTNLKWLLAWLVRRHQEGHFVVAYPQTIKIH